MARAKGRVRYELDPHNRLIIAKSGKKSEVPKYRCVAEGRFKIYGKNSLLYYIRRPQSSNIPQQIKFLGDWSLDKNHDLTLTLNKWGNQILGNKLIIKGKIIDVGGDKLLFAVITKTPDNRTQIYVLKLSGWWQADGNNRLKFNVEKEKRPFDALTLEGAWEVNKRNQLIYKYTKRSLKTKREQTHTIIFKGYWDITDKFRLSYVLSKKLNSIFSFKTSLGIPMKKPNRYALKYEIGITITKRRIPIKRTITIFGKWRIDDKRGLLFEVKYRKGQIHRIVFGAEIKLNKRNNLEVRLKNEKGKNLGIKLTLSRRMLKGSGEAFLKALGSRRECAIHVGAGIIW